MQFEIVKTLRMQKDIPVFFHNGTNYDFNLIINELAK